ncbi:MAG: DegT/DnrJ/EryC1/StrS family aminotransferase [Roseiarcus sp.]|jgi:UDP-4-amino-4-deoxy-L-arabinose-oxoglutarate aminotransferase
MTLQKSDGEAPQGSARIPFFRHDLGQAELESLAEVLAQPILTTGSFVEELERRLAAFLDVRHVLAVTSCTGAMHMSLLALGIGPGDEVITTPMTFVATATAILEAGAKPVFVEVEDDTGNIDAARIEQAITPRTRAIVPVHLYGLMVDMVELRRIADRHGVAIVEDAAHCLEGRRDGARPASHSQTACFSFYATKNLTCGEGGAVATNDTALAEKLRLLRLHGMTKTAFDRHREGYRHWDMTALGWKYNMSNIEAAVLLPQFARMDAKLAQRQALAARYVDRLKNLPDLRGPSLSAGDSIHCHHVFSVWIENGRRDEALAKLQEAGVEVVVNYRPVHLTSYFRENFGFKENDFPVAERIGEQCLSLPFYPGMAPEMVDEVADRLGRILLTG